jgi:hypothetical protein
MEKNKIYNIFNLKNLKHLIRRASRRKKKNEVGLFMKEMDMDLYMEKVNKNWKTRRKKPPDKVAEISVTSLSIKKRNLSEDVRRSHGQGYSSYDEKITINALWERLCWSLYFALTVRRVDLEAENYLSLFLKMLM